MKRKFFIFSLLPLLIAPFSSTNKTFESISLASNKLGLDTSSDKGVFRDYTKEEIKTYYGDLEKKDDLKGDELLSSLQGIISNGQKKISHSAAWNTDWRYFVLLDRYYDSDPLSETEISTGVWKKTDVTCLPLYVNGPVHFSGKPVNMDREHMWPKSRGFKYMTSTSEANGGTEQPYAATDMQNLRMGDSANNQSGHNNYPYGYVKDKSKATQIKDKTNNEITGYRGPSKYNENITVYEPLDKDKGDIARSLFYMAARYHDYVGTENNEPALALTSTFKDDADAGSTILTITTKDTPATYGILSDLLEWNKLDPVDEHEMHRNNLCYTIVQNNRNPFVDYPLWADVAFDPNYQYTVDINKENGIASEGLNAKLLKNYKVGDNFSLNDLEIEYTDDKGNSKIIEPSDELLKVTMKYDNGTVDDVEIKYGDNYQFPKSGSYTLEINYNDTSQTLLSFTVAKVAEDSLELIAPQESKLYINDKLDLSKYSFTYTNENGTQDKLGIADVSIKITTPSGQSSTIISKTYTLMEEGTYNLSFTYNFDGKNYTVNQEIEVHSEFEKIFDEYQLYFYIGAAVLIIIILIIIITLRIKKSKKKKASSSSSKKKKTTKKK